MLDQITPLILTYNEAPNIGRTMKQLQWANDIVVVDSFSDDETTAIASSFSQARLFQRKFDTHRDQWNFGLTETNIQTPWVLALDADYVLTDELVAELKTLQPEPAVNAYAAEFIYCLKGKHLRSGIYPPVNVLYRTSEATYEQDGHTHRVSVSGQVATLRSRILHDDRKSLRRWLRSQVNYSALEAKKLLSSDGQTLSRADRVRKWQLFAPLGVIMYCLFFRGGLLDGWAGCYYALQRGIAESMLSWQLIGARVSRSYSKSISL